MRDRFWIVALLVMFVAGAALGQTRSDSAKLSKKPDLPPAASAPASAPSGEPVSEAERITRLQRSIDDAKERIDRLTSQLNDPRSEYARAETEFKRIDTQFQEKKKDLQKARDDNTDTASLDKDIQELEPRWRLAKDRFDLAIQERKLVQEQIATLETRINQDTEALNKLTQPAATQPAPAAGIAPAPQVPATPPGTAPQSAPKSTAAAPPVNPAVPPAAPPNGAAPAAGVVPAPDASTHTTDQKSPANPALAKAQQEATKKETDARQAEQEARSVTERMEALRTNIEQERKLLETARQRAENAQETERTLDEDLQKQWEEGTSPATLQELRGKISDARKRARAARTEIRERSDRLDELQSQMGALQAEQIQALQEADKKRAEAEQAHKTVKQLENPFAITNMLQWLLDHGPRLILILIGMVAVLWLARVVERHLVGIIARRGDHGTMAERQNRAKTLVSVIDNAVWVIVIPGGLLMIFAELGVNIIPLMGGAAVIGLAAAFGAQSLLKDYFSGFMILLENQYGLNDVVKIGSITGTVERITLRITMLRDIEGVAHFIPNGHVDTVSNKTHGWSRALFDIGVAYKEDTDRVVKVLMDLGGELRRDPEFTDMILEDPEMLGLDRFEDSAVVIRFYMKTRPLMQWAVRREMLRRIKKRFDELGIEIPFPHRTVYVQTAGNGESPPPPAAKPGSASLPRDSAQTGRMSVPTASGARA